MEGRIGGEGRMEGREEGNLLVIRLKGARCLTDLSMMASTSSIKSRNISLLVYFTPVLLHGTLESWPVGSVELTLQSGKGKK